MPVRRYRRQRRQRVGGFLPLLLAGIPAIAATIASAVQAAKAAKEMRGKGLRYRKRKLGHGLSVMKIHSLDSTAGGYRGAGRLAPPGYHRVLGHGLLAPAGAGQHHGAGKRLHKRKGHYRYIKKGAGVKRVHVRTHRVGGYVPYV